MSETPKYISDERFILAKGWVALSQLTSCLAAQLVAEVIATDIPQGGEAVIFEGVIEKIAINTAENPKLSLETKKEAQELFSHTRHFLAN